MPNRAIEVVIKAADEFTKTFQAFRAGMNDIADTADETGKQVTGSWRSMGDGLMGIRAAWLQVAGVVASAAWLQDAARDAFEGEKVFNRLRIQIQNMGIEYDLVGSHVEDAIDATKRYAMVQDDEVAGVLQQLILLTGNYSGSVENLNLVYDLAYQKGIDASQAAELIGKAMSGNLSAVRRIIPELGTLEDSLGENATAAEKAGLAMDFLRGKVSGAMEQMTEHERKVAEVTQAYLDLKESIGGVALEVASFTVDILEKPFWLTSLQDMAKSSSEHPLSTFNEGLIQTKSGFKDTGESIDAFKSRLATLKDTNFLAGNSFTSMFAPVNLSMEADDTEIGLKGLNAGTAYRENFKKGAQEPVRLMFNDDSKASTEHGAILGQSFHDGFKAGAGEPVNVMAALQNEPTNNPGILGGPLREDDSEAWQAAMERHLAIKNEETQALLGFDELIARSAEARFNITGRAYQAYEDQLLSVIETGKFSVGALAQVIASQVKIELVGLAARASIWAIYEAAMGLRDLAVGSPTAAIHFASAAKFAAVAGGAMIAAAGVQALVGGRTERPAPGTIGGEPIRTTPANSPFVLPTRTEEKAPISVTLIVNTLDGKDVNWPRVMEENILPTMEKISGDGNRPINIRVAQV